MDGTLKTGLTPVALALPTFAVATANAVAVLTSVLTFSDVDIIITSANGVVLAEVSVLTALIGAAATLVPDMLKVSDELSNTDIASMVITKLAVLPAGMSTAVFAKPLNVMLFYCW